MLIENLFSTQLQISLMEFEQAISDGTQSLQHCLAVYNNTFAIIDHLVRYQKIASVLPRFSQKSAEFRALDVAMGNLKELRNQHQHINNDIVNDFTGPLLGSINWARGRMQYITLFHDIGRKRSSPSIVFDMEVGEWLHDYCYIFNQETHDLSGAITGVKSHHSFIAEKVHLEVGGKPYNPSEHFVAMRFEISNPGDNET